MLNFKEKNKVFAGLIVAILLCNAFSPFQTNGQTRIVSPYSKYGIGEVSNQRLSTNLGMAGIGKGYRSNKSVNYLNPAAYTAIDTISFVFEAIGYSHFYKQETVNQEQLSNYSSLGGLVFGFPISRSVSAGFGLKPFSLVGYNVLDTKVFGVDSEVDYLYEGSGGLNDLFLGVAVQLSDNFSVGANASYLFGNIEDRVTVTSNDIDGFFKTNRSVIDNVKGFLFEYGVQYHNKISDHREFSIGLTYGQDSNLDITRNRTIQRDILGTRFTDTLKHIEQEQRDVMHIPMGVGLGTWIKYNKNWSGGIDAQWKNWEEFHRFGSKDELQDSYNIGLGIKYSPTVTTYATIFSRASYMAGFRYGQSYLNVNDYNFDEIGVSLGLYIPIRRTNNGVNIGFEYAQRGTTEQNLVKEDVYRINIGVNIYERWFFRRKFY